MKKLLLPILLGGLCLCYSVPRPAHTYDPAVDTDGQDYLGCAVSGTGGDPYLNTLKNRTKHYRDSIQGNVAALVHLLPQSISKKHGGIRDEFFSLNDWTLASQYESKGAMVEGYLIEEASEGEEACNCEDRHHHDYHIWLVPSKADTSLEKAMVVELTPRIEELHPGWSRKLPFLKQRKMHVRVHGWLTFDHEHPEQLPGPATHRVRRATLWEVHPIIYFEVEKTHGQWVGLDEL